MLCWATEKAYASDSVHAEWSVSRRITVSPGFSCHQVINPGQANACGGSNQRPTSGLLRTVHVPGCRPGRQVSTGAVSGQEESLSVDAPPDVLGQFGHVIHGHGHIRERVGPAPTATDATVFDIPRGDPEGGHTACQSPRVTQG